MARLASSFVLLALAMGAVAAPSTRLNRHASRPISVVSVTELGPIKQNENVKARDNGQSVAFDGKSYWFFDDTTMSDAFIANTAAVTSSLDASNNIDLSSSDWTRMDNNTKPGLTIPYTEAERSFEAAHNKASSGCTGDTDAWCNAQFAIWPGPVIADPERGRIIVAYGKLCRGSEGAQCQSTQLAGEMLGWGFFAAYPVLGLGDRLKPSRGGQLDYTGVDPALFGGMHDFDWTRGAVAHEGFAYLYGSQSIMEGSRVARVPLAAFEDQEQWAFWDGSSYQADVNKGVGVAGVGAAGNTIFYSEGLGGFANVFCPFGSNSIYMQTAGAPEGPWSETVLLFDSVPEAGATNYACFAHPEFASADGLTHYISYFQTGSGAQRLTKVQLQ